jgi:hypothetical protein
MEDHGGHSHGSNETTKIVDSHEGHYKGALKGLWALIGLYVFFLGEKLMQIKRSNKEKKVIEINCFNAPLIFFPNN